MEVKARDVVIHYEVVNPSGETVLVFLHGWGHDGSVWRGVAESLPLGYCVYLPDLPGFGRSSMSPSIDGLDEYAELMIEFITKTKAKQVVLIGHSFGAQVAAVMARKCPENICRLVLIAPALKRSRQGFGKIRHAFLSRLRILKVMLPKAFVYRVTAGMDYAAASSRQKVLMQQLLATDVTSRLPQISAPTLLVWGELDRDVLGSGKELASLLPNGKLKVVYDAGHNLQAEKPEELVRILERFIYDLG